MLFQIKKISFALVWLSLLFVACNKTDNNPTPVNELEGLKQAAVITNSTHTITLYTATGTFQTGYNAIYFQVKKADGSLVKNATATWTPMMHMMSKSHSCPASAITMKPQATATYGGHIIFQMPSNSSEYWELSLSYTIDGVSYTATSQITVAASSHQVVASFKGSDSVRYILALVAPTQPKVAINDISAALYKMETMTRFVPVDNYTIKIDPRMPDMGNHSSPGNEHLVQGADKLYHGKLGLTMTGYWKINLQLLDAAAHTLKGEPVSDANPASSIYFELEF